MSNLKRYTLYILNLVDMVSILLAYFPAYYIAFSSILRDAAVYDTISIPVYVEFLLTVIVAYMITNIFFIYNDDDFLGRSAEKEFFVCVKLTLYVIALVLLLFYMQKTSQEYSRLFIGFYSLFFLTFDFLGRQVVKKIVLPQYQESDMSEKVVVAAAASKLETIIRKLREGDDWRYQVIGAVMIEGGKEDERTKILDVPVVGRDLDSGSDFINFEATSVLYSPGAQSSEEIEQQMTEFQKMGKTVHLLLNGVDLPGAFKKLDSMGTVSVLTYNSAEPVAKRVILVKTIIDTLISAVLLVPLALVSLLAVLNNALFSHGSLFTTHVRVGKNGRRFYLYRFRTMYLDCDKRLREGRTIYTPFGRILQLTHLDGLPQIINVLSQEMSLIGVKPVTLQEFLEMNRQARSLYLLLPGIAGSWSVNKQIPYGSFDDDNLLYGAYTALKAVLRYITFQSLRRNWYGTITAEAVKQCHSQYYARIPLKYKRTGAVKKQNTGYLAVKRILDIVLASAGLILLIPVYVIISALIIADDGGVPFYTHPRIGRDGRRIWVFKFRTMRTDAGELETLLTPQQLEQYKKEFKINDDPRVTDIGNFLRTSSLDELPQLLNVLDGSMSLIGPRPIVEEETVYYGDDLETFLSVRPGLTGYWQAYARNNAEYEDGKRQKMELYYVNHLSFGFDVKIFFHTFGSVLRRDGVK